MNKATGSREFAEKLLFDTLGDAARAALKHAKHGTSTAMLLEALLAAEMEIRGGSVEVSKTVLSGCFRDWGAALGWIWRRGSSICSYTTRS